VVIVTATAAAAVLVAWGIAQPLGSSDAYNSALTALTRGNNAAALTDAREAQASNPVSVDPLWLESTIYSSAGDSVRARQALIKATSVQPSNPDTWARLACYDVAHRNDNPAAAELQRTAVLLPNVSWIHTNESVFCATV
jgi:Flp pilus assembly protein TadD